MVWDYITLALYSFTTNALLSSFSSFDAVFLII